MRIGCIPEVGCEGAEWRGCDREPFLHEEKELAVLSFTLFPFFSLFVLTYRSTRHDGMPIVHPACEFVPLHLLSLVYARAFTHGQQRTPLNTPRVHFIRAPYHLFVLGASICGVAADYSRSESDSSRTVHRRRVFRETLRHPTRYILPAVIYVHRGNRGKMVSSCIGWSNDRRWKIRQFAVTDTRTHAKKISDRKTINVNLSLSSFSLTFSHFLSPLFPSFSMSFFFFYSNQFFNSNTA